jgi:NAD(P) transhydrogenase
VHIGLIAMMAEAGADLFNCTCFNYPSFGDLYLYKDATHEAIFKQTSSSDILKRSESLQR